MQQKLKKTTFAIYIGNRGFMPAELLHDGRVEMMQAVREAGYDYIIMDESATRYGAVETRDEGLVYAQWLREHRGEYDGVICCMPIFIDEIGAATALPLEKAPALVARCGGICYPAHIDRQSGGILAILGDFPAELPVLFYELGQAQKKEALQAAHAALRGKTRLYGSDAHHTDAFLRQSTERLPLRLDAAQEAAQQRAALFAWLRGEKH